jgi:hypothetical protein
MVAGLTINVSYDPSVNAAPSGFKTAVDAAVQYFESTFTTPVTINIAFGYGEVNNLPIQSLAESLSNNITQDYAQVVAALANHATSSDDQSAFATLPSQDPTNGGIFRVSLAQAKALGMPGVPSGQIDGHVGLSSTEPFNFDPNNRAVAGEFDAVGALEHEISEVMGRTGSLGTYAGPNVYKITDLFRYASPGVRDLAPGPGFFSLDGTNLLAQYNDPTHGGDAVDWSTAVPQDAFDQGQTIGQSNVVSPVDLREMDVLGWDIIGNPLPVPPSIDLHGSASQYIIADNAGSLYVQDTVNGRDGTQTLPDVTRMVFTNGTGVFDPTGTAEDVARIFGATLDRAPDVAGLEFWTFETDDLHVPLSAVANSFATSPEFIQHYGSLSNAAFVDQLYENVLGRTADAAGAQYWTGLLAAGDSRGTIALGFAQSRENKANTLSTGGDTNDAEAYRLYQAALNRAPDETGLTFWSSVLANGATPTQVAQDFITSAEFQHDFGSLGDSAFVSTLYQNVLHRAADAGGLQFWTSSLQQGASEASVLVSFSDSLENRAQTAGATHANWVFIPT